MGIGDEVKPTIMFGNLDKEKHLELTRRKIREESLAEGHAEGIAEGRAEGQKTIALNLYRSGIFINDIAQYVEVSIDQGREWISSAEPDQEPLAA